MPLSQDDVIQILQIVDESHFNELSLEIGDLKLIVGKKGAQKTSNQTFEQSPIYPSKLKPPKEPIIRNQDGDTQPAVESEIQEVESNNWVSSGQEGYKLIKASILGTFYRSPQPGAPPFVDVGSFVTENDTVCIIEIMKCMTAVKAEVSGEIVKCLATDGKMVEYKQTLFIVNPKPDSQG